MNYGSSLIALFLVAAAAASNPHLRVDLKDDDKDDTGLNKMKGSFSVEKHIKCSGEFVKREGEHHQCIGDMKKEFSVGTSGADIAHDAASIVFDEVDGFVDEKAIFLPDEEHMEALAAFDDPLLEEVDDGFTKTIEFGGFVRAEWACNVTYAKDHGKFSKKLNCGLKARSGMGKGPGDTESDN